LLPHNLAIPDLKFPILHQPQRHVPPTDAKVGQFSIKNVFSNRAYRKNVPWVFITGPAPLLLGELN
jgi:hypothetical protein